ncbi:hypothetical protein [Siminovitchia terrae]|uniref:hypothetical protein n=1 Tax=Siminovitchia terrae TaxID=1914933 RepID=UPI0028AAA4B0|nr:hypothetical protein [Siminovitchia terrae]
MARYRKKPVVVDAFQWTGDREQIEDPEWIVDAIEKGSVVFAQINDETSMGIMTWEGLMVAEPRDYIIKGIQGEIYPCKPDIFEQTYEKL